MQSIQNTIFVVDDTPANLHLLGKILMEHNFNVRLAPSGKLALKSIQLDPPDLILLDIKLPGMDGFEICQKLKSDTRTKDVPVIFISALNDPQDKIKGFSVGGVDYIAKPFHSEEVLARVRTHLNLRNLQIQLMAKNAQLTAVNDQLSQEIAERQQTESQLRESEKRFRALVEQGPDMIIVQDASDQIIMVNPMVSHYLGYTREELLAMKLTDIEIRPNAQAPMDPTANHLELMETNFQKKDGSLVPVEAKYVHMQLKGKPVTVTFARDISIRKQMETERLKIRQLESLALLSGGIAHDLNNLMFIITGSVNLIRNTSTNGPLDAHYLDKIENAAHHASDLAEQLLTFSKGGNPIKKPVSIGQLISDLLESQTIETSDDLSIELTIREDLWPIQCDPDQIRQVMVHLITNAGEAITGKGTIHIEVSNYRHGDNYHDSKAFMEPGNYIHISVSDTGQGILPEHLDMIFDPYFSTKDKGTRKGMGLGLATVYSIIKKHNGYIFVDSQVHVGTTMHLYLPLGQEKTDGLTLSPLADRSEKQTKGKTKKRILVMDDESMIRDLMKEMLQVLGYETEMAANGQEAIEKYKQAMDSGTKFDTVILDLTIKGGMDGKETMNQLKQLDPNVIGIISSGYFDDPVIANYETYGFIDALIKPYKLQTLKEVLSHIQKS